MKFFIGLCNVSDCWPFLRSMVSVNRLRGRKSAFRVNEWIMDSGAFTEISTHGRYRNEPEEYAEQIMRWSKNGAMVAAVSQDYMCEPFILEKTGLSVEEHQHLTIERYKKLKSLVNGVCLMPVIQGFKVEDYPRHVRLYGNLLSHGAWVGVGSVCKRNKEPSVIEDVLLAIKSERPDLNLHGFGIKIESLKSERVKECLYSSDSMAWSFEERKANGGGSEAHDPRNALRYCAKVESILREKQMVQELLFEWWKDDNESA